jgi:hypothetical protein
MREKRHRSTGRSWCAVIRRPNGPEQVATAHPPDRRGDSRNGNGNRRYTCPRGSAQATAGLNAPDTFPQGRTKTRPMTSLRPSQATGFRSTAGITVLFSGGGGIRTLGRPKADNGFRDRAESRETPVGARSRRAGGMRGGMNLRRSRSTHCGGRQAITPNNIYSDLGAVDRAEAVCARLSAHALCQQRWERRAEDLREPGVRPDAVAVVSPGGKRGCSPAGARSSPTARE